MRIIHEDEREDARIERAEERSIHTALRHHLEPETARCRACGIRFLLSALTDDLLCAECDENVRAFEAGKIA
jgi:hypothetical protein